MRKIPYIHMYDYMCIYFLYIHLSLSLSLSLSLQGPQESLNLNPIIFEKNLWQAWGRRPTSCPSGKSGAPSGTTGALGSLRVQRLGFRV